MGGVVSAVTGVAKGLFGGGSKAKTTAQGITPRSQQEIELQDAILADLKKQLKAQGISQKQIDGLAKSLIPSEQDQQIQSLFKNQVSNFLSKRQDGTIDPEALKSATSFVDQTFTNPAQQQLNQAISDYSNIQGARAAALGRSPQDSQFQQQLFGNIAREQANLGAQRGAAIQDYVLNQPGRDIQTSLAGIGGIGQIQQQKAFVPSFLNDLNAQAMNNRLTLLNAQGSQLDRLARDRGANITQTVTEPGKNTGLLGGLSQFGQFGQGIASQGGLGGLIKSAPKVIGSFFGI